MADMNSKFICSRCGKEVERTYRTIWEEDLCLHCLFLRFDWVMHRDKLKLYEVGASFTIYARNEKEVLKRIYKIFQTEEADTMRQIDPWFIECVEQELKGEYKQYSPPEAIIKHMNKAARARQKKRQET